MIFSRTQLTQYCSRSIAICVVGEEIKRGHPTIPGCVCVRRLLTAIQTSTACSMGMHVCVSSNRDDFIEQSLHLIVMISLSNNYKLLILLLHNDTHTQIMDTYLYKKPHKNKLHFDIEV